MQASTFKISFFVIAIIFIAMIGVTSPASAMGEDLAMGLNIAGGLSSIGTTHFDVVAKMSESQPILELDGQLYSGGVFQYARGAYDSAHLFATADDPEVRAQIVKMLVLNILTQESQEFEIDIDHQDPGDPVEVANILATKKTIIVDLNKLSLKNGVYDIQFIIVSKVRARQGISVLQWNVGKDVPTSVSSLRIFVTDSSSKKTYPQESTGHDGHNSMDLLSLMVEGVPVPEKADRYVLSGIGQAEIHSQVPARWFVNGKDWGIFPGPLYLTLDPGSITVRVDSEGASDEMTIVCLAGSAEAKAKADTDIDISTDGTISLRCSARAEAKSAPAFIMALSEPEECEVPMGNGGYYPENLSVFRTDVSRGSWFWTQENGFSPFCDPWGKPPADPPVPPPPSNGWAPPVPPVP